MNAALNDFADMKNAIPRGGGGDHHHHGDDGNRYTRFNDPGCRPDVKTSTPIKRQPGYNQQPPQQQQQPDSPNHFVHPFAIKLQEKGLFYLENFGIPKLYLLFYDFSRHARS